MKTFPTPQYMLLCALLTISAKVLAFPAELEDLHTVTKTIYHTTVRRRSGGALAHLGSDGHREILTPLHLIQRRDTDPPDDLAYALDGGTLNHEDLEGLAKRSASLYALRIPFIEQEGYIALYLSNATATPFCKNISDTLYEDSAKVFLELKVDLGNSTTKIPIREDKAINFCQSVKESEGKDDDSSSVTKTTSPTSGASKTTNAGEKTASKSESNDESKTPKTSTASKADKSTAPKSTHATSTKDLTTPCEAVTIDPSDSEAPDATAPSNLETQTRKASPASTKASVKTEASEASTALDDSSTITSAPVKTSTSTSASSADPIAKPKSAEPSTTEADDESSLHLDASKIIGSSKLSEIASQVAGGSKSEELELETDSPKKAFHNDPVATALDVGDGSRPTPTDNIPSITEAPSTADAAAHAATEPHPPPSEINSWYDSIIPPPRPGAALRARAIENAGTPSLAAWWKRTRKPVSKLDNEDDSPSSSSRVPAKPRPTQSSNSSRKPRPTTTSPKPTLLDTPASTSTSLPSHPSPFNPSPPSLNADLSFSFLTPTPNPLSPKPPPAHPKPHSPPSTPSTEAISTMPYNPSSAWGHVADPRIRWTVGMLWVLAGLQVVLGFWEFVKGVRGRVRVWEIGKVGWVEWRVRRGG